MANPKKSRGAIQSHMRFHAEHNQVRPRNTHDMIAQQVKERPGAVMEALATIANDPKNGITPKEYKRLIRQFLITPQPNQFNMADAEPGDTAHAMAAANM